MHAAWANHSPCRRAVVGASPRTSRRPCSFRRPHDHATADIPTPRLSADAVVQFHDFIAQLFDLFEARYGDQIYRYCEDRKAHGIVGSEPVLDLDDSPF